MDEAQKLFVARVKPETADNLLVSLSSQAMEDKLCLKRIQGYQGWHNQCCNEELLESLKEHIEKGDMIDVMNYAAMIYLRTQLYGDDA